MPEADPTTVVSVEVVLRPTGGTFDAAELTADRISSLTIDPQAVERLRDWFADRGFAVGPSGPMSFSVTAPLATFATTFRLGPTTRRRLAGAPKPGAGTVRLRRDVLPARLRADVAAIVRPAAPDFGPGAP